MQTIDPTIVKQVFPALEIMGWFTCGSEPRSWEFTIQAQMKERYDSPLLVMLDPSEGATVSSGKNGADLPLTIYETTIEVSHASTETKTLFIEAYWKLETGESERIAVDHISKANTVTETGGADGDASCKIHFGRNATQLLTNFAVIAYLTAQSNAVRMLSTRVNLLRDYVEDVKCERTSGDHQILTQISALCQRLPAITGAPFKKEFDDERGDVMLLGHLAALTKGAKRLSDISDMYETIRKEMKSHAVFPTDTQRAWGYRSPPGLSDCK